MLIKKMFAIQIKNKFGKFGTNLEQKSDFRLKERLICVIFSLEYIMGIGIFTKSVQYSGIPRLILGGGLKRHIKGRG